jgi:hypothetical protein
MPLYLEPAAREIAAWQEYRVKTAMGKTFRSTATRIVIRRPRWMPERVYAALMRTIVIEERTEIAPVAPRAERRRARLGRQ